MNKKTKKFFTRPILKRVFRLTRESLTIIISKCQEKLEDLSGLCVSCNIPGFFEDLDLHPKFMTNTENDRNIVTCSMYKRHLVHSVVSVSKDTQ